MEPWNEVFVMKLYRLTIRNTGDRLNYGMMEDFVMDLYRLTIGHTGHASQLLRFFSSLNPYYFIAGLAHYSLICLVPIKL